MTRAMPKAARLLAAAALVVAGLAGCAAPGATTQACRAERATELPARLVHGQLIVPVHLDGKPLDFLLDTGSEGSMITPEAANRLGLARNPRRTTTIHGTGGSLISANADVRRFEVGAMAVSDQSLAVGPVPSGDSSSVAGLLGTDWLGDFDVDLDVPHRRVALWRVQGCGAGFDPLRGRHFTLPLIRTTRGRVLVPVVIDGLGLFAYLDSGAVATIVTATAAARLGVTDAALARDPGGVGLGVDMRRLGFRWHRFAEIVIGPERFRNITLPVSAVQVQVAGALLGADYLAHHRVWISPAGRRVFIEPIR
jgi:predicted aspartyl protease